jgi:hypothetical protein
MPDWRARLREWFGIPYTDAAVKEVMERDLREQRARIARIDAALPRARRVQIYPHPHRRATDARR